MGVRSALLLTPFLCPKTPRELGEELAGRRRSLDAFGMRGGVFLRPPPWGVPTPDPPTLRGWDAGVAGKEFEETALGFLIREAAGKERSDAQRGGRRESAGKWAQALPAVRRPRGVSPECATLGAGSRRSLDTLLLRLRPCLRGSNMHLATYAPSATGKLLSHYDRSIGERDHIDKDGIVYNLAPFSDSRARYRELTEGLEMNGKTRPLADILVTMPKDYAGDDESFFKAAYDHLREKVGEGRVVSAYVHLDEPGAQPHMHFCFVPVVETPVMANDKTQPLRWTRADEKKNPAHKAGEIKRDSKGTVRYRRVQKLDENGRPMVRKTAKCSAIFSKEDMERLHPEMEDAMCKALGVEHVGLLLDEDSADRKLSGLKHNEYVKAKAQIEATKAAAAECRQAAIDEIEAARALIAEAHEATRAAQAEEARAKAAASAAWAEVTTARGERDQAKEAKERYELGIEYAKADLKGLNADIADTKERLECLRRTGDEREKAVESIERAAEEAAGRADDLETVVADVRGFDAAPKAGKLSILDRITSFCNGLRRRFEQVIDRLTARFAEVGEVEEERPGLDEMVGEAKEEAARQAAQYSKPEYCQITQDTHIYTH